MIFIRIKVSRDLEMFCLQTPRLLTRNFVYAAVRLMLKYAESDTSINEDFD